MMLFSTKIKLALGGIGALFALILIMSTYFQVEQYERTVVTWFGKVQYVAEPGFYVRVPFANNTQTFRVDNQEIRPNKPVNTYTIDNQEVDVAFNVFFHIAPNKVEFIYTNYQDYKDRLYTMAVDRLKVEMGKVNVTSVAEKRGELRDAIFAVLKKDAASLGVDVTEFTLTDLQYTPEFRKAVEQAATQKAGIETREYERQQAQKVAETAKVRAEGEANAVREKARGDADARLLQAAAEAKAIQLQGEAQAAAIDAQATSLNKNPRFVELRQAERWNGQLPQWTAGGTPLPILNLDAPGGTARPPLGR